MNVRSLLPDDLDNPVSYCLHKANHYANTDSWKKAHINIVAARAMAALVPFASFLYGVDRTCRGLYHITLVHIKPEWVDEHINGWEELKTGLKCIAFTVVAVAYAALAIIFGKVVINSIQPSIQRRSLYERNLQICKAIASSRVKQHVSHHNGVLVPRPALPLGLQKINRETLQILQETYELSKLKGDKEIVQKAIENISTEADQPEVWKEFKRRVTFVHTIGCRDIGSLENEFKAIISGKDVELQKIYDRKDVISYLESHYSHRTVKQMTAYYCKEEYVTSRQFHAILVGIQANLTIHDINGSDSGKMEDLIAKLDAKRLELKRPNVYQSDEYYVQYDRDCYFLDQRDLYIPPTDPGKRAAFDEYGLSEYLSRYISYIIFPSQEHGMNFNPGDFRQAHFQDGMLFTCPHEGRNVLFEVKRAYFYQGIAMAHIVPVGVDKPDIGATIFRGTHDWDGMSRNLEYLTGGVGKHSFNKKRDDILEDFSSFYKEHQTETYLVTGHSLGACDAQRFVHAMLTDPECERPPNIQLHTYNSPGVETNLEEDVSIQMNGSRINTRLKITHTRVLKDIVQRPGKVLIGKGAQRLNNVSYTVITDPLSHHLHIAKPNNHTLPVHGNLRL